MSRGYRAFSPFGKALRAILCFLTAAVMGFLLVMSYQETVFNAKLFTVPVTGIVQSCEPYRREEPSGGRRHSTQEYAITVSYEASGRERTLERKGLNRSYQKGEEVSLLCNEGTGEAMLQYETKHNVPLYVIGVITMIGALCYGIWLIVSIVRG